MTHMTLTTSSGHPVVFYMRDRLTSTLLHPFALCVLVVGLFAVPSLLSTATVQIIAFALVSLIFAQSLFVLTGLAGQISLGHAAFFGLGAYGSAILSKSLGLSLLLSLPGGIVVGALVAYLLSFPAGRVREVYLAMMTLGFGQIFFELAREWSSLTGGVSGFSGIPSASLRTLSVGGVKLHAADFFRALVVVTVCVLLIVRNLSQSRFGRALCAIHHSEFAAGSVGIARGRARQFAYAVSGGLAGLAGAFYAHLVGYIGPDSFGVSRSVEVLVVSIVGGMLSSTGQVVSAVFFAFLPERLQAFNAFGMARSATHQLVAIEPRAAGQGTDADGEAFLGGHDLRAHGLEAGAFGLDRREFAVKIDGRQLLLAQHGGLLAASQLAAS